MRRNTPANSPRLSPKHNFLFVSDLHLAEGIDPQTGKIAPLEDFFFDGAFANMLVYHVELTESATVSSAFKKPWKLYINGDFLEFLQVISVPDQQSADVMNGKIKVTDHFRQYGLGTSSAETVWKLNRIAGGHQTLFQALGWFLAHPENELVLMRGNHDVETVWPEVQEAIYTTISASYYAWYHDTIDGRNPESPLPLKESLPASLDENFRDRIHFPEWFDYEEGLFYVEHGNQYDPVNSFSAIDKPFLKDRPNLIELPSGSFFVRYLFNTIEQIHPFADNIRPLSSYIHYALSNQATETISMLLRQPHLTFKALANLLGKSGKFSPEAHTDEGVVDTLPLSNDCVRLIEDIRFRACRISRKRNRRYIRGVTAGVILRILFWLLVVIGLGNFITGNLLIAILSLVFAGVDYIVRLRLMRFLNSTNAVVGLDEVADAINHTLNNHTHEDGENHSAAVQFLIFGHDHSPKFEELSQHQNGRSYRQWYVNTGSWLPSYDESERVIRNAVQLPFLRIVPDLQEFDNALPELLDWRDAERRPYRLRLIDKSLQ